MLNVSNTLTRDLKMSGEQIMPKALSNKVSKKQEMSSHFSQLKWKKLI